MIKYRIKEMVDKEGLSGRQFALKAGISHNTAALLIKAKSQKDYNVSIDVLDRVCRALKCQPKHLLKFEDK